MYTTIVQRSFIDGYHWFVPILLVFRGILGTS